MSLPFLLIRQFCFRQHLKSWNVSRGPFLCDYKPSSGSLSWIITIILILQYFWHLNFNLFQYFDNHQLKIIFFLEQPPQHTLSSANKFHLAWFTHELASAHLLNSRIKTLKSNGTREQNDEGIF